MAGISKREQIITSALALFYQQGFHATGIDKIIAQAGVSKKTLYNHFKSKDELILATLRKRDEVFRNNIMRETERLGHSAKERLLTIFDAHQQWFDSKDFSGCMFINASAEFSAQQDPNHMLCTEHKRLVRDYLKELATEASLNNPELIGHQLHLLLEGAIVEAYVSNNKKPASLAKGIAEILINNSVK